MRFDGLMLKETRGQRHVLYRAEWNNTNRLLGLAEKTEIKIWR